MFAEHEAVSRLFELGTLDIMEIAAISGHKSLSMLKRYTHLRAQRLVRKLEGNKHKGKQVLLNHLIPYPAIVEDQKDSIRVRFLDFVDLSCHADNHDSALQMAQDALMRRIMNLIRSSSPIPTPDQYLEIIDERRIVMVDPLGEPA